MTTKLAITEDTSERVVVREKREYSTTLLFAYEETTFDRLLHTAEIDNHILFRHRRREIPFSDIQSVDASRRPTLRAQDCVT